ncbi:hypothetical protein F5B22DRAFT_654909 [Xylaria bambusicola]|uniref:uncharacterized protein n=1 Tax=Xylaria bambusicola TaxID=326684 RepID=UPI0020089488|nr:uncharacterized protein F5B22DRAFT_654909 [Xylaria bambusicola]KAI0517258.1 hypothetical protein F5B22DRAFT_654909 [Xylaria bambusicola]
MASMVNKLVGFFEDKAKEGDAAASSRKPIEAYGLRRDGPGPAPKRDTAFMEPYTGNVPENAEYINYRIMLRDNVLCQYLASPQLRSYVTMYVELLMGGHRPFDRYTKMLYRDMMVDNYLDAGGDLKTWKYIGANHIINDTTRTLIQRVMQERGLNIEQPCSIDILPSDKEFAEVMDGNPFTRGIQGLLRKYEKDMGGAQVKRIAFIIQKQKAFVMIPMTLHHLVVELCRPGEDGYPNETSS